MTFIWRMAATSAGRERGKTNRQTAGNSNRDEENFLDTVEHDCSVNGSEVGCWADMDYCDDRDEEKEGSVKDG